MRPVLVKAYGSFYPASEDVLAAVDAVLSSWFIEDAAELKKDMLVIGFEGDAFPDEEVISCLKPFMTSETRGKLDVMDLEAWTLRRWIFTGREMMVKMATLNKALDTSLM